MGNREKRGREKRGWEVHRKRKRRMVSRVPKVAESGKNRLELRKIVLFFCNRKDAKRREPTKIGQELGLNGTESLPL